MFAPGGSEVSTELPHTRSRTHCAVPSTTVLPSDTAKLGATTAVVPATVQRAKAMSFGPDAGKGVVPKLVRPSCPTVTALLLADAPTSKRCSFVSFGCSSIRHVTGTVLL